MSVADEPTPAEARAAFWFQGDLLWKLHATQAEMRAAFLSAPLTLYVLNCARRLGKSLLACVLAIECCLQRERSRVWYGAPTTKDVRTIIAPLMWQLLVDCPAELRPTLDRVDSIWRFPNGSEILMVGVNNQNADSLRGNDASLALLDEAGQLDELEYVIESILRPMALRTDGRILLLSTPAPTPAHPFTKYCATAEAAGAYATYTIDDAVHLPRKRIERFIAEAGGREATSVRREYYCEHVVDDTLAVLPEFVGVEREIAVDMPKPRHLVPFVVADVGYHDLTAVLFGWHDFRAGLDVVAHEEFFERRVAAAIDARCAEVEASLFDGQRAHVRRYADAPAMVLAELSSRGRPWGGIAKKQTDGAFKVAAVNDLRTRLRDKTIRIAPSCTKLLAHCRYAVWRLPGKDLERLPGYGHFDGVDALTYFVRLVDRHTNPYPRNEGATFATHTVWPEPDPMRERLRGLNAGGMSRWRRT